MDVTTAKAAYDAASARWQADPTPENKAAALAAWSDFTVATAQAKPRTVARYASRAALRQAAERRQREGRRGRR